MTIDALKSDNRPDKGWARVTLSLDEIDKLLTLLNEANDHSKLHSDMFLLFELVQKGTADNFTHSICIKIAREAEDDD